MWRWTADFTLNQNHLINVQRVDIELVPLRVMNQNRKDLWRFQGRRSAVAVLDPKDVNLQCSETGQGNKLHN